MTTVCRKAFTSLFKLKFIPANKLKICRLSFMRVASLKRNRTNQAAMQFALEASQAIHYS